MTRVPLCFRIVLLVSLMSFWVPCAFSHGWRLEGLFYATTWGGSIYTDEQGLIDFEKSTLGIKVNLFNALGVSRVEGSIDFPEWIISSLVLPSVVHR